MIAKVDIHQNRGEIESADDVDNFDILEVKVADEGEYADSTKDNKWRARTFASI